MFRRPACAVMLVLSLGACQETKITDPTLIIGSGPVAVLQSSFISSGDSRASLGAGPVTYIVSRIELTNDQSVPFSPVVSRFYLTDRAGGRSYGIDTGSSALTGISNDVSPLKPGDKRTLTIGFRAEPTTMGTIRYEY